ncbi:MAG TPA: ATP-binding protein [Candidatus Ozemobacteraceae bacterium]|nr:ATP-binding protein [Candidatus Ozemobacteraceae bacterium]
MQVGNVPEIVGKVADRLMQETEGRIRPAERLGIRLGLIEIIRNAIEHGNLGITYDEKTAALDGDPSAFERLISERMADPSRKERHVDIRFQMDGAQCEWIISDEGAGFDWQSVPDPNDPANLLSTHGRGILLTRLNFDAVSYFGRGNQVSLRKSLPAT